MLLELGRCEDWLDLFTPHALVRFVGANEQSGVQQLKGRDELLVLGRRLMLGELNVALGRITPPLRCRHFLGNITVYGDSARSVLGYAYLAVNTIGGAKPRRCLASGMYSDKLHMWGGGWCFESRTYIADGEPDASIPVSLSSRWLRAT